MTWGTGAARLEGGLVLGEDGVDDSEGAFEVLEYDVCEGGREGGRVGKEGRKDREERQGGGRKIKAYKKWVE